jgi:ABC-2 type transport system permease protein
MSGHWLYSTRLVARREFRQRLRAKSFVISTLVLMAAVAASIIAPSLIEGGDRAQRVAVVGAADAASLSLVRDISANLGVRTNVTTVTTAGVAENLLRTNKLDVVVLPDKELVVKEKPASTSRDNTDRLVTGLAQQLGLRYLIGELPTEVGKRVTANGLGLPVRGLQPERGGQAAVSLPVRLSGVYAAILVYLLITFYGIRIAVGVAEEKAGRIVEVLLATMRPAQLLTGKVLGMGALAVTQVVALLGTALVASLAVGTDPTKGTPARVVAVASLWFLLGYALYCTAFAAAGSLIARPADTNNATLPLQLPLIASYALSFSVLTGPISPLQQVLAYLPPTAPVMMPVVYAAGGATIGQVAISAGLCLLAIGVGAKIATVIYARAILRTGRRVKVREVLRLRDA